ncbi:GNAT family N-acetyltransferase [Leeia aquatica]|uniref:GNAT family N-acetyltransferase n=1 Tax=Leeia aquatica TaxID=2725557 RepID=A0A847S1E9_9NEIS|nr:GNAT family N-acetyltransferase [Leeia aquatica]NLR75681.1 GNAT family N-acetyltransferase [Leeia aquatica]
MLPLHFRAARRDDLPRLVALLADDGLGRGRETPEEPLHPDYLAAFDSLDRDPNQLLLVVEHQAEVLGMLQLTFIPGLSRRGATRAHIEAVRVDGRWRGQKIGERLMQEAIRRAEAHGCQLVQLTSDRQREAAHRFYQRLGFAPSHTGFKLRLPLQPDAQTDTH